MVLYFEPSIVHYCVANHGKDYVQFGGSSNAIGSMNGLDSDILIVT